MSESMSKSEIEGVVSSIRRLVTEEQLQQRPVAQPSDKLVLTPALRIDPAVSDVRQPSPASEPVLPVPEPKVDPEASAAHQAAAALEAALMRNRDDWEPEGTELLPSLRSSIDWDLADGSDAADMIGPESSAPAGAEPADHRPVPAELPVAAEPSVAAELPVPAELSVPAEPSVAAELPVPAELSVPAELPVAAEPSVPAEPSIPAEPLVPAEPTVPAEPPAAMAGDSAPENDVYWDDYLAVHRSTPLLEAEQAEPWRRAPEPGAEQPADLSGASGIADAPDEQPVAGIVPEPAPDAGGLPQTAALPSGQALDATGQGDDADRPATLPSDRLADQGVLDRPLDDGPSAPPVMQDIAPRIDDALLRDLIRDVLREELHGELGERITRNVRKLVRAELARALAARDLT